MLDVCLLGTAGMMPSPTRWLTALMLRYNGSNLLIDSGEGTQIAIKETGISVNPIDVIMFTHYHADHISGLPGLLLSMGNADRTEPVTMVGPKGLEKVVNSLRVIAPELPFEIKYIELSEPVQQLELNGYNITAFKLDHKVLCYGYSVEIKRAGKFDAEKAKEIGIPLKAWNPLQKGNDVDMDGNHYTPDMVMGPDRKGLKVTYCTDSRPIDIIAEKAENADLFICEGMYGELDKEDDARKKKHMMFYDAAKLAARANVKELWLTHFSPSLYKPKQYMDEVRKIFPNSHLGEDGKFVELDFEKEQD